MKSSVRGSPASILKEAQHANQLETFGYHPKCLNRELSSNIGKACVVQELLSLILDVMLG